MVRLRVAQRLQQMIHQVCHQLYQTAQCQRTDWLTNQTPQIHSRHGLIQDLEKQAKCKFSTVHSKSSLTYQ